VHSHSRIELDEREVSKRSSSLLLTVLIPFSAHHLSRIGVNARILCGLGDQQSLMTGRDPIRMGGQQHLPTHSSPSHRLSRSSSRILTRNHQTYSEYSVLIISGAKHHQPFFQIVGLSLMSRRFKHPTGNVRTLRSDKLTSPDGSS
jgi:hypothetical protein